VEGHENGEKYPVVVHWEHTSSADGPMLRLVATMNYREEPK
jgi:hypothetical protein